jgi:hypothetical protein
MEDSHQQHAATRAVVEPHEYGAGKEPDHHRRAGQVSPPVAAIIKECLLRRSTTPAQRLSGRSGQRIKIQDHHVTMILIYAGHQCHDRA